MRTNRSKHIPAWPFHVRLARLGYQNNHLESQCHLGTSESLLHIEQLLIQAVMTQLPPLLVELVQYL